MPHSSLPRRSVLFGLLAAPLTVAACSKDEQAPAASSTTTGTPSTTTQPSAPAVTGAKLPADLLATMTALYLGGKMSAVGAVGPALAKRKPLGDSVTVGGTVGTWKGSQIAVVTQGQDVTLLVKKSAWSVVGGWWPSMGVANVATAPKRILVIGSDARPSQSVEGQRADAIHIIGVDSRGVGGVVGIPRDSWVPLSTGGSNKINAAMTFGGIQGMVKTVQGATGIRLDGYILTGFKGFAGMVNAMGGIRYVAAATLKNDRGDVLVRKGLNILGGGPALSFARERHMLPNGDFGRSANQGQLILAGMRMVATGGHFAIITYLSKMAPHVETDLSPAEVLTLAAAPLRNPRARVQSKVVAGAIGTRGGQSVVVLGAPAQADFRDMKNGRLGA